MGDSRLNLRPILCVLAAGLIAAASASDIVSIKSDYAQAVVTAAGSDVDFKITLNGTFALNSLGGTWALPPELRVVVNGSSGWASLYAVDGYRLGGTADRTDVHFRYRVRAGDMAQPLKIYCSQNTPYQFYWNGWELRNTNTQSLAVWRFAPWLSLPAYGEVYDLDLAKANITLRTLSFNDEGSPSTVPAKTSATWRVDAAGPVESGSVDFYVWTHQTNIVQLGDSPGQRALLVSMPSGAASVDFPLRGLSVGAADIYLQRTRDYLSNTTVGVTNYIKRTLTITDPPPAVVQIVLLSTGTGEATYDETDEPDTGAFQIELTEAFTNDVWVRMDTSPAGQSNVTFNSTSYSLCVPAGSLTSLVGSFSAADGGGLCALDGVRLTPVITNPDASNGYTHIEAAIVRVQNVRPVLLKPLATDTLSVYRGQSHAFQWSVSDVAADLGTGMEVTWQFGDGSVDKVVTGATGTVIHAFTSVGVKSVRVIARDKDGGESDEVQFTVSVDEMPFSPQIRVFSSRLFYGETTSANTGDFRVHLSEPYPANIWVRLTTDPLSQSNLVFASTNAIMIAAGATNSASCFFSLSDGTQASELFGITVTPVITNALANAYFTDVQSATVYVTNRPPNVTSPSAQTLQVPIFSPRTFSYSVADVSADLGTMIVRWNFGDGVTVTVTGAVGSVTHAYSSLGSKTAWVEAEDKDGGLSSRVQLDVTVVPLSIPTVRVNAPRDSVPESTVPRTGDFTVTLSEAFTNTVTVALQVTPETNAVNGALLLTTNRVVFAVGETQKLVLVSARDGTDTSLVDGFTVTPSVVGSMTAIAHFTAAEAGIITLQNVPPVINAPIASDLSGSPLYTLTQGAPFTFSWSLSDVPADRSSLRLNWYFGDGGTLSVTGATGVCAYAYLATGDFIVTAVATDKDGGYSEVRFKVRVDAASGFAQWAARHGLSGYPYDLFALDWNADGIANGFEYAFGDNLTNGVPLMNIRVIDGSPVIETPKRASGTTGDAILTVQACTRLQENQWTVPMGPSNRADKPADRDWYEPLVKVPGQAFFRLQIRLE